MGRDELRSPRVWNAETDLEVHGAGGRRAAFAPPSWAYMR